MQANGKTVDAGWATAASSGDPSKTRREIMISMLRS